MKTAILKEIRKLDVEDVAKPSLRPMQVIVKIKAVSICGTDVHEYEGKLPTVLPRILGHDFSGLVEEIGEGVEQFRPGDRVAVIPSFPCYVCQDCKRGNYVLCRNKKLAGLHLDGCHREYMLVPESNLVKLPDNVSFEEAATLEPFTVALNTFDRLGIKVGESVAVLGQGPMGLGQTQIARLSGAGEIIVTDVRQEVLDLAKRYGATTAINSAKEDPAKRILEVTEGKGVDAVIDAAGVPQTTSIMLNVVRKEGKAVCMGVQKGIPPLDVVTIIMKTLTIYGVGGNGGRGQYPRAVDLVSRGLIDIKSMITHRFPFAQVKEVFEMLSSKGEKTIKVMLQF